MSNRITFNQVATPDFSDVNTLLMSGGQQYQNAAKGLADTLKGVQTEVRSNNNAQIQNYLNQATAEQLQNPEFRQGYQNLLNSLKYEYDAEAAAKNYDARIDTLSQRANQALQEQSLKQGIRFNDQVYSQNETRFNNEQIDRQQAQNTKNWFVATDPRVKETLYSNGVNPELAQQLQAGKLNIDSLSQKIKQTEQLFPLQLKQAKGR